MRNFRILFRPIALLFCITMVFYGCEMEELQVDDSSGKTDLREPGKPGKIDICHYSADDDQWVLINVKESSWADHVLHGDVRLDDQDGDGYVPDNECGVGPMGDCDDLNPDLNVVEQEWYNITDNDEDGYYLFEGVVFFGPCPPGEDYYSLEVALTLPLGDCDDENPNINPGADEICDEVDDDCDGRLLKRVSTATYDGEELSPGFAFFGATDTGVISAPWSNVTPADGCSAIAEDLSGKIALIDRGFCFFSLKAFNAQERGAVAVVICFLPGQGLVNMAQGDTNVINIPVINLTYEEAEIVRNGTNPNLSISVEDTCVEPGRVISNNNVNSLASKKTIDLTNGEVIDLNIDKQ